MPDSKMMEEYVNRVLEHLGKDDLSKVEEVLGAKLSETRAQADNLRADIERMKETLKQAQERLKNLTVEYSGALSKAAGVTESLLALKFGDEIKKEQEEKRKEIESRGNGSQDPSVPKKKKKRAKRSPRAAV